MVTSPQYFIHESSRNFYYDHDDQWDSQNKMLQTKYFTWFFQCQSLEKIMRCYFAQNMLKIVGKAVLQELNSNTFFGI